MSPREQIDYLLERHQYDEAFEAIENLFHGDKYLKTVVGQQYIQFLFKKGNLSKINLFLY